MSPTLITKREQQGLLLKGQYFSREQILVQSTQYAENKKHAKGTENTDNAKSTENTACHEDLFHFLAEWFDDKATISVHTSGSTGTPKIIELEKDRMIQSAYMTCTFLDLHKGDSTLLCMPLQYIGAKMLVVRALVVGLDLYYVKPSTHPLKGLEKDFAFVPMTPQQVLGCLETPEETLQLRKIKHLLLGGMAVNTELQIRLADFPHSVWSSYGMTETLSHIALRKINGMDATDYFIPFPHIKLDLSEQGTLRIHAPTLCKDFLTTTDIAEILPHGGFRILGRADNIINSGGIKIQIEAIEDALSPHFSQAFQITALPDVNLGEKLVLLLEKACPQWELKCSHLQKYKKPKQMIIVPKLPCIDSGKPDRYQARLLAKIYS